MTKYLVLHEGRVPIAFQRANCLPLFRQQRHHILHHLRKNEEGARVDDCLEHLFSVDSLQRYYLLNSVIASTATYPFVVVRTVMFDSRGPDNVLKFMDVGRHVMKDHGFLGFYAGLKPDLIRLIPSNAIVFIVY
jgi:hypothetical protein